MKSLKRIIALLIAIVIAASACLPAAASSVDIQTSRPQYSSLSEYKSKLWEEGYPVFTTAQFLKICSVVSNAIRLITGQGTTPRQYFNVEVDEIVTESCNYIYENCGLDIVALMTHLPETKQVAELTVAVFDIDTAEFREQMYNKRDEYHNEGNDFLSKICFFLGAYLSIMDKCEIYAEPTDEPNVYEVRLRVTFRDGGTELMRPHILINTETGWCGYKDGEGLVGLGFDFSLPEMMVYATINAWMRDYGFCLMYDVAAGIMPMWNYITRRFKFDYADREWMIQIWKGNYLITNGGEVGVYNRDKGSFGSYYNCAGDEDLMEMSLEIWRGDKLLVYQEPQMHWWINGFNMSDKMYIPQSLTMKFSIVMMDEEMLNAFCKAIDNHYRKDVTYTVDGLKISVVW